MLDLVYLNLSFVMFYHELNAFVLFFPHLLCEFRGTHNSLVQLP